MRDVLRSRLPFRAAWLGEIDLEEGEGLEVRYVGEGSVVVGPTATILPANYQGQSVELFPPAGRHRLEASFRYDDGSRVGMQSAALAPSIHIAVIQEDGKRRPLAVRGSAVGPMLIVALLDGAMALSVVVLIAGLSNTLRVLLTLAVAAVWGTFTLGISLSPWMSFGILLTTAVAAILFSRVRRPAVLLPVALAVAGMSTRGRLESWTAMVVRSGGDDWLTYEGHARSILETWSLAGGESVFYYQPLYRYVKFLLRMLLGEADFLTYAAMSAGFFGGALVLTALVAGRLPGRTRWLAAMTAGGILAIVCSDWAQSMTLVGLSEPLGWALFLWAIALLFCGERFALQGVGIFLAGLSAITRLNHLPAVLLTAGTFFLHRMPRMSARSLALAAIFASVLLLPLLHNLVYGGAFVLTTASAAIPENLLIRPVRLFELWTDPELRGDLLGQLYLMVNASAGWWSFDPLLMGLRVSEALWVGACRRHCRGSLAPDLVSPGSGAPAGELSGRSLPVSNQRLLPEAHHRGAPGDGRQRMSRRAACSYQNKIIR